MIATYALLALAILALWVPAEASSSLLRRFAWLPLFVAALLAALATGIVRLAGAGWLAAFAVATATFAMANARRGLRIVAAVAILLLAAGLTAHQLPGFNNPRVISAVRFSPDALPFSLHLNFDKTVVGLFLLGFCHPRIAGAAPWRAMVRSAAPVALGLIAVVMALSLGFGYVRFEPKFPRETWLWLGVNLVFTCVAEEALFRGFIQARLQQVWARLPSGEALACAAAAVLFGLAHAAGGAAYVGLATVAGLGYGWIYQRTGRIEASILTHFTLNTVHFFAFTYPALQSAV